MFKNNKPRPMSRDELYLVMQDYKRKLWAHIEERQAHQVNERFVAYAEGEIERLSKILKDKIAA